MKIFQALANYVAARNMGEVRYAPVDVILCEEDVLQPDILGFGCAMVSTRPYLAARQKEEILTSNDITDQLTNRITD